MINCNWHLVMSNTGNKILNCRTTCAFPLALQTIVLIIDTPQSGCKHLYLFLALMTWLIFNLLLCFLFDGARTVLTPFAQVFKGRSYGWANGFSSLREGEIERVYKQMHKGHCYLLWDFAWGIKLELTAPAPCCWWTKQHTATICCKDILKRLLT